MEDTSPLGVFWDIDNCPVRGPGVSPPPQPFLRPTFVRAEGRAFHHPEKTGGNVSSRQSPRDHATREKREKKGVRENEKKLTPPLPRKKIKKSFLGNEYPLERALTPRLVRMQVPSGVDAGIVPDMVMATLRANGHKGIVKAINAHGNLANIPLHTQQVRTGY